MWHVDEGALHAYLDGALDDYPAAEASRVRRHLDWCPACAARLEEERVVRDEAAAVLAGADPGRSDPPPLEELRRRAHARARTGDTRHAKAGRGAGAVQRIAWAASIVVALGAGWMIRGRAPRVALDPDGGADGVASRVASPASPESLGAPADPNEVGRAARAGRGAGLEDPSPARSREAVEAGAAAGGSLLDLPDLTPPAVARSELADLIAPPRIDSTDRPVVRLGPSRIASARERVEDAETSPDPAGVDRFSARVVERGDARPAWRAAPFSDRGVPSFGAVGQRRPSGGAEPVRPVEEGTAEVRDGSLVVPGLRVVSVSWIEMAGGRTAVRALQVREEGDTLEILHLPPEVGPSEAPGEPGPGRNEVAVELTGGWAVLRAAAGTEDLEALARRLRAR